MFNRTQARAVAERAATLGAGYLVGKGLLPAGIQAEFVGLVMALLSMGWGYYNNRATALVQKTEATPEVQNNPALLRKVEAIRAAVETGPKVSA